MHKDKRTKAKINISNLKIKSTWKKHQKSKSKSSKANRKLIQRKSKLRRLKGLKKHRKIKEIRKFRKLREKQRILKKNSNKRYRNPTLSLRRISNFSFTWQRKLQKLMPTRMEIFSHPSNPLNQLEILEDQQEKSPVFTVQDQILKTLPECSQTFNHQRDPCKVLPRKGF